MWGMGINVSIITGRESSGRVVTGVTLYSSQEGASGAVRVLTADANGGFFALSAGEIAMRVAFIMGAEGLYPRTGDVPVEYWEEFPDTFPHVVIDPTRGSVSIGGKTFPLASRGRTDNKERMQQMIDALYAVPGILV